MLFKKWPRPLVLRRKLQCALALACVLLAGAGEAHEGDSPERRAWVEQGEARLAAGDMAGATAALEPPAAMSHDPDTEMALVRAAMTEGGYHRALAFAAHVAGGHVEEPSGALQYAWLLALGGQGAVALKVLAELPASAKVDGLEDTRRLLASGGPVLPPPALLATPLRVAPHARMVGRTALPATLAVGSTGLLLPGGTRALAPSGLPSHRVWLRDGLGRTVGASIERTLEGTGLDLLRLDVPLKGEWAVSSARTPFAGSPVYSVTYAADREGRAAWPWMQQSFVGRRDADAARWRMDRAGPGAPVFDGAGQLLGLTVRRSDGALSLVPMGAIWPALDVTPVEHPSPGRMPTDRIYELGMRHAVQVLVDAAE
jgi:hypothetical protein